MAEFARDVNERFNDEVRTGRRPERASALLVGAAWTDATFGVITPRR